MDNTSPDGYFLVFTPDEATRRRYRSAFGRLRIYPGYVGPIVRTTGDIIRIGDTLKAWPSSQFRALNSFAPGELAAYRAAAERSHYAEIGPADVCVGDRIFFRPSELCDLIHRAEYWEAGLFPGYVGFVTSVTPDGFVDVDRRGVSLHRSEFLAVGADEGSEPAMAKGE